MFRYCKGSFCFTFTFDFFTRFIIRNFFISFYIRKNIYWIIFISCLIIYIYIFRCIFLLISIIIIIFKCYIRKVRICINTISFLETFIIKYCLLCLIVIIRTIVEALILLLYLLFGYLLSMKRDVLFSLS